MKIVKCDICNNFIEESSVCPYCDTELSVNIDDNTKWVTIKILNDEIYAQMLVANLNRAGIPAFKLVQSDSMRPLTLGLLSQICIKVPEPFRTEAENQLKNIENGALNNE